MRLARALGPRAVDALHKILDGDPECRKSWCAHRQALVRRLYAMYGGLNGMMAARDSHVAESLQRLHNIRAVLDVQGFSGCVNEELFDYVQGTTRLSLKDAASETVKRWKREGVNTKPTIYGDTECYLATEVLEDKHGESGRWCVLCRAEVYGRRCVGTQGSFIRECGRRASSEKEAMGHVMGSHNVYVVGVCADCVMTFADAVGDMMIELVCGCKMVAADGSFEL